MISARHPLKDQVAFAGAATTGFVARNSGRSPRARSPSRRAHGCSRETGLTAADVDGICGSIPEARSIQSALGIPEVTWFANPVIPFVNQVAAAAGGGAQRPVRRRPRVPRGVSHGVEHGVGAQGSVPSQHGDRGRRQPRPGVGRRRRRVHGVGVALPPRVRGQARALRLRRDQRSVQRGAETPRPRCASR